MLGHPTSMLVILRRSSSPPGDGSCNAVRVGYQELNRERCGVVSSPRFRPRPGTGAAAPRAAGSYFFCGTGAAPGGPGAAAISLSALLPARPPPGRLLPPFTRHPAQFALRPPLRSPGPWARQGASRSSGSPLPGQLEIVVHRPVLPVHRPITIGLLGKCRRSPRCSRRSSRHPPQRRSPSRAFPALAAASRAFAP